MTNEKQYSVALDKLFMKTSFSNEEFLPWIYVANELNQFFVKATRQEPSAPVRPLSYSDLQYINMKFFSILC